ncbi:H-NS family nucleoid-associated regulatory protein [Paraburkholderia youngii]|uniref:H-NS histone family protein n=1 Tax=Paraburkholderia youngii TaxID=2782701 RepID=UPI003D214111
MSQPFPYLTMSDIKALRANLGLVNDRIADARAREVREILAQLKEHVALYNISQKEIETALGFNKRKGPLPAKYRDPTTGDTWSGKGRKPQWLVGKRLDAYHVDAQPWWPGEN